MPTDEPTQGLHRRKRRPPPTLSRELLERAALRYLERYETTAANLRLVLLRKVSRSIQTPGAETASVERVEVDGWIEEIITQAVELGQVDDRRYAEGLARELERQGSSHRAAWHKLARKGISNELIREQLGNAPDAESELLAAAGHARRRRLGPWRMPEQRNERRERDLASLARAGFGLDVARRVVDAESPDALPDRGPRGAFS